MRGVKALLAASSQGQQEPVLFDSLWKINEIAVNSTQIYTMPKTFHEIRDPIHVFVRLDSDERRVVDSLPFQRLRHIRQLAMTYLVYPGATHTRFEHSLGVMELATRVFDVITKPEHVAKDISDILPTERERTYWRTVVRMAALCHDLGHLPFSHAGEDLLPKGWDHERLTLEIINSEFMADVWKRFKGIDPKDVAKIAVGPKSYPDRFDKWEAILSEIIVGDAFGVDRMDYLLRDSHHAGVAYGRFDHYRLIDTLRILPKPWDPDNPALGVEEGGLHSAEALLLARYFMFTQLYCHHVRRIYDIHLRDFLSKWLPEGNYSTTIPDHLRMTDNEVWSALSSAEQDEHLLGHESAKRIVRRKHFKRLYERNPEDLKISLSPAKAIYDAAVEKFGQENIRLHLYNKSGGAPDFPVITFDGRVVHSLQLSEVLQKIPATTVNTVFIDPELYGPAETWLKENREAIIRESIQEEEQ
jgi:uncharacterized protein